MNISASPALQVTQPEDISVYLGMLVLVAVLILISWFYIRSRQQEKRLSHQSIELLPFPILICNLQGQVIDSNKPFQTMFEVPVSLSGWLGPNCWNPEIAQSIENNEQLPTCEYQFLTRNGEACLMEVNMRRVKQTLCVSFINITSHRTTENKLAESQRFLSNLVEYSGAAIYVKSHDGKYELVNRKWEEIAGLNRDFMLGKTDSELFIGPNGDLFRANDLKVLESGKTMEIDEYLDLVNGKRHFLSIKFPLFNQQGNIIGLCGISSEITRQKRAEERLRESELNYRTIFNAATEAIFVYQLPGGRLLHVNNAMLEIYGYETETEVLQTKPENLSAEVEPYIHENFLPHVQIALNQGQAFFEWLARKKNGETFWIDVALRRIQINGQDRLLVVARDSTWRKKAEAALRESEENYRALVDLSPDGIAVHRNGVVVFANQATLKLLGAKELAEIIGQPVMNFIAPESQEVVFERIKNMLTKGENAPAAEEKFLRMDGSILDVETIAMPIKYQGYPAIQVIVRDITERKQMIDSLRASEERYRTLIETTNTGIFMVSLDGKILQANSAVMEVTGFDNMEEFMQIPVAQLYADPNDRINLLNQVKEQGYVKSMEVRGKTKQGKVFWASVSAILMRNADGTPYALLGSMMDITERKNAQEVIRQSEQRLRALIENSADALTLIDINGNIIFEGPTVYQLTGYTPEERRGQNAFETVHPEDLPEIRARLREIQGKPGGTTVTQFRAVRKDGSIWWVEGTATNLLHDPAVGAIVVNYRDVTRRKLAEDRLQQSERQYRQIIEASPMGIHMYRVENHELIFVGANRAADRILGINHAPLVGKSIQQAFPNLANTEIPRRYRDVVEYGLAWEQVQVEYGEEGIRSAYETHAFPTSRGSMTVLFLDITGRKIAEDALRKSNEQNRAIVAALPDLLFHIRRDGLMLNCIASNPSLMLIPAELTIGRNIQEILPPDVAIQAMDSIHKTLDNEEMDSFGYALQVHDKTMYFESRMTPLNKDSVLALVRDVSESRNMEEAMRYSEQRYRTLFEQANDAILMENPVTGQIVDANQRACDMLGYTRQELLSLTIADITANYSTRESTLFFGSKPFESVNIHKNGREIPVEVTNATLSENLVLSIVRDITERKSAEDALRQRETEVLTLNAELEKRVTERTTQLEMTNKELEAFAYSVSHDLRAPLRAIDGFSRIIMEDHEATLSAEVVALLQRVRNESRHMGQLIDALLGLSRMSRAEMHLDRIILSDLVEAVRKELEEAQPTRKVEWTITGQVSAHADARLMRVVFENLVSNAWKFTSKREIATIEFGVQFQNGENVYFIRDNGAGFNMTYAHKLFGAFQRLHSSHEFEGTGIGLATVQRIIFRHGGRVWAESEINQGATFFFTLGSN